ncbi:hypothetical protein TrCOL_g2963 [Triparma columacea]|uniref:CW-type domain-containing protein n=1 Tax=Triparma columacea TaxID=722753 RepID=A0A9W7L527_9STRA|nr:hypothetical protein TrCOL_g2963 [Triparma columacea]
MASKHEYWKSAVKEKKQLMIKLIEDIRRIATEKGLKFDPAVFDDKKVRDRILGFFSNEVKNAKNMLKTERLKTDLKTRSLSQNENWVLCDSCQKWRLLPPHADMESLPDKWYCELNIYDERRNNCSAKEQTSEEAKREHAEKMAGPEVFDEDESDVDEPKIGALDSAKVALLVEAADFGGELYKFRRLIQLLELYARSDSEVNCRTGPPTVFRAKSGVTYTREDGGHFVPSYEVKTFPIISHKEISELAKILARLPTHKEFIKTVAADLDLRLKEPIMLKAWGAWRGAIEMMKEKKKLLAAWGKQIFSVTISGGGGGGTLTGGKSFSEDEWEAQQDWKESSSSQVDDRRDFSEIVETLAEVLDRTPMLSDLQKLEGMGNNFDVTKRIRGLGVSPRSASAATAASPTATQRSRVSYKDKSPGGLSISEEDWEIAAEGTAENMDMDSPESTKSISGKSPRRKKGRMFSPKTTESMMQQGGEGGKGGGSTFSF